MIYFDELEDNTLYSIIEGIYLSEKFSERLSNSEVIVCPNNIKYIIGKTVIINKSNYTIDLVLGLLNNNCKIISRVFINHPEVDFQPYIIRPDFGVMWNGMIIDVSDLDIGEITKTLENRIIFNLEDDSVLYFPKLVGLKKNLLFDEKFNITGLGWLMHQVGINIKDDIEFLDLDLLKTKKLLV